jgi:tRNA-specific 2-thiouridylase
MKVLAAVSGGVDSAVAMARAADAGHDVTAVHLALSRDPQRNRTGSRGCCSIEDSMDARRAAAALGVPFYVWDFSQRFAEAVIDDFIAEYLAGHTPNPCVRCNERIKFAAVLERAMALGFDAVVTGHYARIVAGPDGPQLRRAADPAKDQSYVLGMLTAEQLRHCMFPLGDSVKGDVRAEAAARGLSVASKPDSHDICFIPDGDTAGWLRRHAGQRDGEIVDAETGDVIGAHRGTHTVTVGQRRGLGLDRARADREPRYVVGVEPERNVVLVGTASLLTVNTIVGSAPSWTGAAPTGPLRCEVQIRAHADPVPGTAHLAHGQVVVALDTPLRAVAPGQSMVLYDGDRVLGQSTIARTER